MRKTCRSERFRIPLCQVTLNAYITVRSDLYSRQKSEKAQMVFRSFGIRHSFGGKNSCKDTRRSEEVRLSVVAFFALAVTPSVCCSLVRHPAEIWSEI